MKQLNTRLAIAKRRWAKGTTLKLNIKTSSIELSGRRCKPEIRTKQKIVFKLTKVPTL